MALVASWFAQNRLVGQGDSHLISHNRNELIEAIHRLPIYAGMALKSYKKCEAVAQKLHDAKAEHIFILGTR